MTEHKPWLSLPDEEPPERGFAELMAAARVKADVMANPPWWKRLFAVARRPPVLALATVVVVVCGVIVVGHDRNQAMTPAPAVDVPAGPLDMRTRGVSPEPPPPPPQSPPVEKKLDPAHREPVLEKQRAQTEAFDQAQAVKSPEVSNGNAEAVKAPGVRKGNGNAAADPLEKCRAAAARRDCATAKACVKQVGRVDVGDDATLKSCL